MLRLPIVAVPFVLLFLAGCGGGHALVKDVKPLEPGPPLAQASDGKLAASIDAVLVRNGPGAWSRDADWDEYVVRVRPIGAESIQVREVALFDALDIRLATLSDRDALVEGTSQLEKRYGESGKLVKSEDGTWRIVAGGALATVGVAGVVTLSSASFLGGSAAAAGGAAILLPVLIVGGGVMLGSGIVRAVNNSRVNEEIVRRRTVLPLKADAGRDARLTLFFPMTPLARQVEIVYADARGEHVLRIDISAATPELHAASLRVDPHLAR